MCFIEGRNERDDLSQADIRNPLSLLAHNQITALQFVSWGLQSPTDTRKSPYPPLSAPRT